MNTWLGAMPGCLPCYELPFHSLLPLASSVTWTSAFTCLLNTPSLVPSSPSLPSSLDMAFHLDLLHIPPQIYISRFETCHCLPNIYILYFFLFRGCHPTHRLHCTPFTHTFLPTAPLPPSWCLSRLLGTSFLSTAAPHTLLTPHTTHTTPAPLPAPLYPGIHRYRDAAYTAPHAAPASDSSGVDICWLHTPGLAPA